jgi:membrane protein YdbS with pleckstrin-like domain
MPKEKTGKINEIKTLTKLNVLLKLRLVVITIFALMTLSIILILANQYPIGAGVILISYIMVLVLMVKLLITKEL